MKYLIIILLMMISSGCGKVAQFTTTFPDGKTITMNGILPSDISAKYVDNSGVGINEERKEYEVKRNTQLVNVKNASLINLSGFGGSASD